MKTIFSSLVSFAVVILILAAVILIVAAANFLPFWSVIPLGIPAAAAVVDMLH